MGVYYSPFDNLVIASKRSTVQTLALIMQNDIDHFTLNVCLKEAMLDLKSLVIEGFYDDVTKTTS